MMSLREALWCLAAIVASAFIVPVLLRAGVTWWRLWGF